MQKLSEAVIVQKIQAGETFAATIEGGAFSIKIDHYVPVVSTAIHNGGNMRPELQQNCLLSQDERYYEEDPHTGSFINQQPITLIAHDSRYEYDLNRAPESCVYETAWGKEIWKIPLSPQQSCTSKEKHALFYRIVTALFDYLCNEFGQCIVYDIHSYNYLRHERTDLPLFNVGTTSVTDSNWRPVIDSWLYYLTAMKLKETEVTVAENDIFFGKGYLAEFSHNYSDSVMVLATELKKVFMDELSGTPRDAVLRELQELFNKTVQKHSSEYMISIT